MFSKGVTAHILQHLTSIICCNFTSQCMVWHDADIQGGSRMRANFKKSVTYKCFICDHIDVMDWHSTPKTNMRKWNRDSYHFMWTHKHHCPELQSQHYNSTTLYQIFTVLFSQITLIIVQRILFIFCSLQLNNRVAFLIFLSS